MPSEEWPTVLARSVGTGSCRRRLPRRRAPPRARSSARCPPRRLEALGLVAAAASAAEACSGSTETVWANRPETQLTNWSSSLSLTSEITPRPNCAGFPVIARSVNTSTSVCSPLSAN